MPGKSSLRDRQTQMDMKMRMLLRAHRTLRTFRFKRPLSSATALESTALDCGVRLRCSGMMFGNDVPEYLREKAVRPQMKFAL